MGKIHQIQRTVMLLPVIGLPVLLMLGMRPAPGMAQSAPPTSNPSSPRASVYAHVREGDRAYAEGKFQAAVDAYTEALKLFNQNEYAYYNRGNAYRRLKDYPAAIRDYTAALQLEPRNTFSYLYRGMSYLSLNQPEQALADYTAIIKIDEQNALAYNRRAEAYAAMQQLELARADFLKASDLYKKQQEQGLSEKALSQLRSLRSKKDR